MQYHVLKVSIMIENHARETLLAIEKDKAEIREQRLEEKTRRRAATMQAGIEDDTDVDLPAASQTTPKSTSTIEAMYTDLYGYGQTEGPEK